MERSNFEEENIIKDVRNLFRLKRENDTTSSENIRNVFRLKKEAK